MMDEYWNGGHMGGTDIWGFMIMLLVAVLIIVVIISLVRYSGRRVDTNNDDDVLNLLKKRYANGEIDKKDYEEKHKTLSE